MKEYLMIGLVMLVMEICYLQIAKRLRIVDKPHLQSSHKGGEHSKDQDRQDDRVPHGAADALRLKDINQ